MMAMPMYDLIVCRAQSSAPLPTNHLSRHPCIPAYSHRRIGAVREACAHTLIAAVMTGTTSRGDAAWPAYLQNGAAVLTWSSSWNAPLCTSACVEQDHTTLGGEQHCCCGVGPQLLPEQSAH